MENNNSLPVPVPDEKPKIQAPATQPPQGLNANPIQPPQGYYVHPNQPPHGYYPHPYPYPYPYLYPYPYPQQQQPGQPRQMNIGNLHYGYAHPGYVPPNPNGYHPPPPPNNLTRPPAVAAEQMNEVELGARKIDQQLESGWFDCYKKFLFGVAIYALVRSSASDNNITIIAAYVCGKLANYMVMAFVLIMQFAYHKKEVSKAKWAVIMAYIACVLQMIRAISYVSSYGELDPLNTTGEKELTVAGAVFDMLFVIGACIVPGGKVRDLLEKRLPALDTIPDPPLVEPEAFDI